MIDYSYTSSYLYASVEKLAGFYKDSDKLPETVKIRSIMGSIRGLFRVPQTKIKLYVAGGARIYKFEILSPDSVQPLPIGAIYYLPLEKRLDLYDYSISWDIPMIQWKNKKVVSSGCSILANRAGYDKLFQSIVLSS